MCEQMWTSLKNQIVNLVAKLTRKLGRQIESSPGTDLNPNLTSTTVKEKKFDGARMSENRLQALDGAGYRQCYMDKLRQVASDSEPAESNREYWFGRDEDSSSDLPIVPGVKASSTSNTKLPAQDEQGTTADSGSYQQLTQSGSRIPGIIKAIPTRARVTSTQLKAYVESLPKPED